MFSITLPPELLALDRLQQFFVPATPNGSAAAPEPAYLPEPDAPQGETMSDYWAGFIGSLHSSDTYPEGSSLSQDTGRKFAEGMVEKRRQGKL